MTVLVLSHMFPNELDPGDGVFVLEQVKALRKTGTKTIVVAPRPWAPRQLKFLPSVRKYSVIARRSTVEDMTIERPAVFTLPKERGFAALGVHYYLSCRKIVARLVQQHTVDLIHAHAIMPDGLAAVLLGREFHIPVVCTVHGSDVYYYPSTGHARKWVTQWALRRVDGLVSVSHCLGQQVIKLIGERPINIVHNGADPSAFTPICRPDARRRLGLKSDGILVIFLGYLRSEKALDDLLRAFVHLRLSDAQLCVVGDGPQRSEWMSLAQDLGISAQCMFVGARPHEEIPLWLSASDCLVLCSLSEGLPTTLPEAMLCRVPIVATAVGGIPEVVRHGETGLLVPPRNPMAISHALKRLLTEPDLSAAMTMRAETYAKYSLTWEANARQMVAIYEKARRCSNSVLQRHRQNRAASRLT